MSGAITISIKRPTIAVRLQGQGPAGHGVPTGGTTGQGLRKKSNTNYDTEWSSVAGAGDVTGPASATAGNLAALDATGKVLSDSGSKPADFATVAQGALADTALQPATGLTLDQSTPQTVTGGLPIFSVGLVASRVDGNPGEDLILYSGDGDGTGIKRYATMGDDTGPGGSIEDFAGMGLEGPGGDVAQYAGDSDSGDGGDATYHAGNGAVKGGRTALYGGSGGTGAGGAAGLYGGSSDDAEGGNVTLAPGPGATDGIIDAQGKLVAEQIGVNQMPSAYLHLPASEAAAGKASAKIDPGVKATVPVSGNVESDGNHLYWTNSAPETQQLDNPAAASKAEMETGTEAGLRTVSPLRVAQAIAALAATKAQGSLADTAVQPGALGTAAAEDVEAFEAAQAAASQVEMEAGTEAGLRSVSPLRVAQAIAAQTGAVATLETIKRTLTFSFSGGGAAIPAGLQVVLPRLPFGFTPTNWHIECSAAAETAAASAASIAFDIYVDNWSTSAVASTSVGGTLPSASSVVGATAAASFTDTEWAAGQSVLVKTTGTPTAWWAVLVIEGTSVI